MWINPFANMRLFASALFTIIVLVNALFIVSFKVSAADIVYEARNGNNTPTNHAGGYLDIGVGVGYMESAIYGFPEGHRDDNPQSEIGPFIKANGRYQYNQFFIEAFSDAINGFALGYNFYQNKNWSIDFYANQAHGYLGKDLSDDWKNLKERDGDLLLGFRATYYHPLGLIQLQVGKDFFDLHSGGAMSLYFAKNWQIKNWNVHAVAGGTYHSANAADYYIGVDAEESQASGLPEYQASGGFTLQYEAGVTYPINENWVYRAVIYQNYILGDETDSPILVSDKELLVASSVSYVF